MSINVYLTGAEVNQAVTTASVAKVLTDSSISDIWANSTSLGSSAPLDRVFNIDWSLSNWQSFFQIQFDHNDEDAYLAFDTAAQADPDPESEFDVNVTYRINGGEASSSTAGFFNIGSANLYNTPIQGVGALSTDPSLHAGGAALPADFTNHGFESADNHTPKNLYMADLAEDLFGNAGTAELLSNENTIALEVNTAGANMKDKLDALINDQNSATNSIASKTGKNNSTLIVGKLLRAMMKDEFSNGTTTVNTASRVNDALALWKAHNPSANTITDSNGNTYTVWEVNNSGGADYFNLGACFRVGEQLRMRVKFTVNAVDGNAVEHGRPGPTVFSAVDSSGSPEDRTHDTKIHEFRINLIA